MHPDTPTASTPRRARWLVLPLLFTCVGCTFLADEFTALDRAAPARAVVPAGERP